MKTTTKNYLDKNYLDDVLLDNIDNSGDLENIDNSEWLQPPSVVWPEKTVAEAFDDDLDEILGLKEKEKMSQPVTDNPSSQRRLPVGKLRAETRSSEPKQLSPVASAPTEQQQQQQQQLEEYQRQFTVQEQQIKAQQEQLDRLTQLLTQLQRPEQQRTFPTLKYRQTWQKFRQFISGPHGSSTYQPRFSMNQIVMSYLGSFLGIAALAYISVSTSYPLIAAPFGAAAVLVFAVPSSPLAQPRNLIVGNLIGGLSSLIMVSLFGSEPWVMALAVATAIKVMQLTKTLHPPGGAVALVGVMSNAKWEFLFTPVLTGSIVLLICTYLFNNLMPGRSYPEHWL